MLHGSQKHTANTKAQRFEWANKNIFSRNLVLVEVSYCFRGGQISDGGPWPGRDKFPRKFGPGGQIFGGAKFPVTPDPHQLLP